MSVVLGRGVMRLCVWFGTVDGACSCEADVGFCSGSNGSGQEERVWSDKRDSCVRLVRSKVGASSGSSLSIRCCYGM